MKDSVTIVDDFMLNRKVSSSSKVRITLSKISGHIQDLV